MCRGEYMITKYILRTCTVLNEVDFSKENYDTGKVGTPGISLFSLGKPTTFGTVHQQITNCWHIFIKSLHYIISKKMCVVFINP